MLSPDTVVLVSISAVVALAALLLVALNVFKFVQYSQAAAAEPELVRRGKVAWVLSIAAAFTGPFGLLLAIVALAMALWQFAAPRASDESPYGRTLAKLAFYNATFILLAGGAFLGWTLHFID